MKRMAVYVGAVLLCCIGLIAAISCGQRGESIGENALVRLGYDSEYGVACYRSLHTGGISCVKVK